MGRLVGKTCWVGRAARLGGRALAAFGGLLIRLGVEPGPLRQAGVSATAELEHTEQGWRVTIVWLNGDRDPDSSWFPTEAEAEEFRTRVAKLLTGRQGRSSGVAPNLTESPREPQFS